MDDRFLETSAYAAAFAIPIGVALLFAVSMAKAAAAERPRVEAAVEISRPKLSSTAPALSSAKAVNDEQLTCDRPRRRLWIEGEGWIVRRVPSCHSRE
jgi:hypothetical protein